MTTAEKEDCDAYTTPILWQNGDRGSWSSWAGACSTPTTRRPASGSGPCPT